MALTVTELNSGILYWRTTRWPQDFHNAFYAKMAAANPNGNFEPIWWAGFLPVLSGWKAIRPKPQALITRRATSLFPSLSQDWATTIEPLLSSDISSIRWNQISSFPALVSQIKDVSSPVFTSKFCHFLAPHIFPVVDNAAMGNPFLSYQSYYSYGQSEWFSTSTTVQGQLAALLELSIGVTPIPNYPMICKIIELCLIGRHTGLRKRFVSGSYSAHSGLGIHGSTNKVNTKIGPQGRPPP